MYRKRLLFMSFVFWNKAEPGQPRRELISRHCHAIISLIWNWKSLALSGQLLLERFTNPGSTFSLLGDHMRRSDLQNSLVGQSALLKLHTTPVTPIVS